MEKMITHFTHFDIYTAKFYDLVFLSCPSNIISKSTALFCFIYRSGPF